MPKKNKSNGAKPEAVSGRTYFQTTTAAGAPFSAVIAVNPASFPRVLAMADVFEFYRFTHLKLTAYPISTNDYAVGVVTQGFDNPPTTMGGVIELPRSKLIRASTTVPQDLMVSRKELVDDSPLKWFKTIAGSPADQFENQAQIYLVSGTASAATQMVIEWTVEFSQWNLAAQSPMYVCIDEKLGIYRKVAKDVKSSLMEGSIELPPKTHN